MMLNESPMGDEKLVKVKAIENSKLLLRIGCYLDFKKTHVIPSFRWNLVFISTLDKFGYSCSFGNNHFNFYLNSNIISTNYLSCYDNLYLLNILASFNEIMHMSSHGIKHKLINENSALLWYKCLGNISKNRIEKHVFDGILDSLDFTNFDVYVNCINGKQTNIMRVGAIKL